VRVVPPAAAREGLADVTTGFIKVCGMTDAAAVEAALDAGADAIGFVFAASMREVTPAQAAALAAPARGRALCVAVTLHPDAARVAAIMAVFQPDVWQTDWQDYIALPAPPVSVATLPVLRDAAAAAALSPGRVLFEGPRSGTGQVADWSAARRVAATREVVLAGGLNPANVAEAIAAVRPFGVDVSSGVEAAPGRKDPARIHEFVTRARAAFALAARETEP
jgi:phosphoribosylanthranilate isomerase